MCIARKEPIVHPEYPKCVGDHLWETSKGMYVFTDETGNFSDKYTSIEAATEASYNYGEWLCGGLENTNAGV